MRRSRDRFWRPAGATPRGRRRARTTAQQAGHAGRRPAGDAAADGDKQDAYDTLHTVLDVLCRVAAPFLPFLAEAVYRGLTGERSVHLQPWPEAAALPADPRSSEAMDLAREVSSAGHSIRKAAAAPGPVAPADAHRGRCRRRVAPAAQPA